MADRVIPRDRDEVVVKLGKRELKLTNLRKPFWPELGITKGDLLQYYVEVSGALLPHLRDRAMVMKRYPNGVRLRLLLHEARAVAAAAVARDLLHRARLGQRHRLPDGAGPTLPSLGREPRLHRPEPVVRALRRHRPARLPALRPRPDAGRDLRAGARGGPRDPRGARRAPHAEPREDDRLARHPYICADRARADAEGRVGVQQDARGRGRAPEPEGADPRSTR